MTGLSVYIHIPFCIRKCQYCDFLSAPASIKERKAYGRILLKEIRAALSLLSEYLPESVYIGGGTPSLFPPEWYDQLGSLFDLAWGNLWREREVTMEANPGTLTAENLKGYRSAGINRLSMGLQSMVDSELKTLGRIHTFNEFVENYKNAVAAGFSNINVDLMSGIPGQTLSSCLESLERVIDLEPQHISSYSLILEEGTPFYTMYAEGGKVKKPFLPNEEEERLMYHESGRILREAGYLRYEISNYAREGFEAVHNTRYWKRKEYLGFGIGAASFLSGYRFRNPADIKEYERNVKGYEGNLNECKESVKAYKEDFLNGRCEIQKIDETAAMEEFMFLGLRMAEGVSKDEFYNEFGRKINSVYKDVIAKYVAFGLLKDTSSNIFLTDRGIDVSNQVMAGFLMEGNGETYGGE